MSRIVKGFPHLSETSFMGTRVVCPSCGAYFEITQEDLAFFIGEGCETIPRWVTSCPYCGSKGFSVVGLS